MSRINAAFLRALDLNADPVSGGQAFVYNAGTTDPVRTYSDVQLTSVQASPVVADAAGNFPDIYAASGSYKVVIQDAEGVTLYEADNVDIGGSSLVGSISPEDYTARGDGTGDDTDAMREFFAALPGRVGDLTPGATYVINSKLSIPGGDFTLNANGATLDFSGISNDDGDVAGALLAVSGAEQSTNQIITITTATTAFGLITTTVTMNDEHGLSVGDEVLVSSDDIIDTGHNDANERRGQFMRVEELQGAFSFKSTQKLYETLPTNPVLTPISWAENIHIDGILRIKGPGRRPTEAGFIGLSFKYVRDVNIGDLVTEDVDYQVLSRDNCLRAHAGNLTFRFPPQGASTAVQYGDTFKNASTDCSTLSITSYGGKHPFDWTRNTTPGIGRHTRIGHILAYDTWDSVVATHGNSRDLNFTSVKGLNCLYVFGSRVADVRVDDIYGENCYEVLKITDDTRNLSVGSVRGKNVSFVVRAKDTPTTSNEGWIGSLESRNINIERVEGLGVTNNTLFLDWSDIPVFTEADAAVTGGSDYTIVLGAFPAPAEFDVNQYNFSGALTGSEIAMVWNGGGATVQTRTITGHTYAGGVNTLTVGNEGAGTGSWSTNPVAGTSTYTIRSFVDDINIGRVISKNCVGSDVFVTGNLRRLVIGDMDVISETNLATAAVLIQGTANTYPDGVTFGAIRRFQKTAPVVSSFAQNVTFEANITDPLILSADPTVDLGAATKQYVDNRIAITPLDFGAVGDGVADDSAALIDAMQYDGVVDFGSGTYRHASAIDVTAPSSLRWEASGAKIIYDGPSARRAVYITIPTGAEVSSIKGNLVFDADQNAFQALQITSAATGATAATDFPSLNMEGVTCKNAYRASTDFSGGDALIISGGFHMVTLEDVTARDCFMAIGAEIFASQGIFGITLNSSNGRYTKHAILKNVTVENIWPIDPTYQEDADGIRIFQDMSDPDATCLISGIVGVNITNRLVKLHSAPNAIVDGWFFEKRSSVLPQSGAISSAVIEAQRGPATILNGRIHFDGIWNNEFVRGHTDPGDNRYGGAIVSGISALVENASGNAITAVAFTSSADGTTPFPASVFKAAVSHITVEGEIIDFVSMNTRGDEQNILLASHMVASITGAGLITSGASSKMKYMVNNLVNVSGTDVPLVSGRSADVVALGCEGFTGADCEVFVSGQRSDFRVPTRFSQAVGLPTYTVSGLPTAADFTDFITVVSNGDAGSKCLAVSNGTSWLRVPLGAAVSAT